MRSSFKSFRISAAKALMPVLLHAALAMFGLGLALHAQTAAPAAPAQGSTATPMQPAPEASKPSISLSPAVIMAKGSFGQGLTQTLTLTNQTGRDFAFELVAEDVIIKD